jgi:cytochrome c oxidase subunit I
MLFAFMYHLATSAGAKDTALDRAALWMFGAGGFAFGMVFLAAGAMSVPRRWAAHLEPWMALDKLGTLFALVIVLAVVVFVSKFLGRARAVAG